MIENFKDIAEKVIREKINGYFKLLDGRLISSYKLKKTESLEYPYMLYFNSGLHVSYTKRGRTKDSMSLEYNIIDFIADENHKPCGGLENIEIVAPEGYIIDEEKSTPSKIMFKRETEKEKI